MRDDLPLLNELVKQRYLSVQRHPDAELLIFNYTAKTQYEHYWTPETTLCRGLITTLAGDVVARPFPKIFNLAEYPGPLPNEPFEVFEKLDGSLGILYVAGQAPQLATRGSFTGFQAQRGTRILQTR